jgi:argininosuccinate synthase
VTGSIKLSLYKGNVDVVGRRSENSLYRNDVASFTMGAECDQKDAAGFIRILRAARARARAGQERWRDENVDRTFRIEQRRRLRSMAALVSL